MRNEFTITITDLHGARHYSMRQVAKKIALGALITVVVGFVLGSTVIHWQVGEVGDLKARRDALKIEYEQTLADNTDLLKSISTTTALLNTSRASLAELQSKHADVRARYESASSELMRANAALANTRGTLAEERIALAAERQELEQVRVTLEQDQAALEETRKELETTSIELAQAQIELIQSGDEVQQTYSALSEAQLSLAEVTDELGDIEMLIGLRPDPAFSTSQRLNTASQTALERRLMLQMIPSGNPLSDFDLSSGFGYRKHPLSGQRKFHSGIDLRVPRGTEVFASADGMVEFAGYQSKAGYGNLITLSHNYGFSTAYGHLKTVMVEAGDFVKKGQQIGLSGNTGASSGPHLHYEVRHLKRKLDPQPFVHWNWSDYDEFFDKEHLVKWDSLATALKERLILPAQLSSQTGPALSAN